MKRVYELMIIFEGDVAEPEIQAQLGKVEEAVVAGGGKIATTDNWGKRRFAYEIDHKWEGTYVVLEIVTEARDLHDVERMLRLADETVVRHKNMRLPDYEATRRGLLGDEAPVAAGEGA